MPGFTLTDTITGKSKSCIAGSADGAARCCIAEVRYVPLMHDASVVADDVGDLVVTDEAGAEVGRYRGTISPRSGVKVVAYGAVGRGDMATPRQVAYLTHLIHEHGYLGPIYAPTSLTRAEASRHIAGYRDGEM